jgi:hypothetical protein
MPYTACRYAPPPMMDIDPQMAICTDEAGTEWWLNPETSDDVQFKAFLADGGEIDPYEPPEPPEPEEPA